jgi:hypothetical protein
MAVEEEMIRTDRAERNGGQSRGNAGRDRLLKDTPPEKVRRLSNREQGRDRIWETAMPKRVKTWKFPVFNTGGELVWLRAVKNRHVPVTIMMHQGAMRLGLPQNVTEEYLVQLRRGSGRPEHILQAEGVETLEYTRSRAERGGSRIF